MSTKEMNVTQALEFIKAIRTLTGVNAGASAQSKLIVDNCVSSIALGMREAARDTLRHNRSEGPSLSDEWAREKWHTWHGSISDGGGNVTRPTFAMGKYHKNVWTGTLDSELDCWARGGWRNNIPWEIHVGYRSKAFHPVTSAPVQWIAEDVHFGHTIPARPFLNANVSMKLYRIRSKKRLHKYIRALMFL